jgi:hypothetical protein
MAARAVRRRAESSSLAGAGEQVGSGRRVTRFREYLRTFVLHRHLELLPSEALRKAFVLRLAEAEAQDDPRWTLDYWRLNMRARKPGSSPNAT